ncbi:MAG: hypothetical protein ABJM81_04380 [Rhodopirellula bahusiensis]|uniref:hypothetical protein n=1 Tax=Rhodopirellula bahusiensis TaxID=2014065 RepID=UPI00329A236C
MGQRAKLGQHPLDSPWGKGESPRMLAELAFFLSQDETQERFILLVCGQTQANLLP